MMGENFTMKNSVSPIRRYSDSAILDSVNICDRLPPLHDLVSTNNQKNEELNEMSSHDNSDEVDDIDEDWFSKLTGGRDQVRIPSVDGSYGLNCAEIPLLCEEDLDFKEKTLRTLRVGLKKIWRRGSATITAEDPTYKVAYLGNVLTGWAKGEGCIDKPLNTLWKNYNSSTKPDVQMKISVTQSGLKAVTKDHGLIEYWSHRITYCTVPQGLPRIFCWVYRHEGRKLKQELRCHAVLCSKESVATRMAATLKLRLSQALLEFKRDKLLRQNARLSLANSVYDNPSLPRRKILLSTGSHNYKPPLERSKSAPKLKSIEESLEEEETTPKVKRKYENEQEDEEEEEEMEEGEMEEEPQLKNQNLEEKCEYKLTNLNFVKKLCSSIENLVESTSNYSKKFLTERKSRDFCLGNKKPEESILKKAAAEEEKELGKKSKPRKNVSFHINNLEGRTEIPKCTEYKKLDDEETKNGRTALEITLEVRDPESDEGSNSLQSISSCCSDVSSLVTNSSDKSVEPSLKLEEDLILDCKDWYDTPMERLCSYLDSCSDPYLEKVMEHPTGENVDEEGSLSEEDVASDESGYVELVDSLSKRMNLDSKEKDLPYHKIIKSTMLRPGRTKTSCLYV